MAWKTTTQGAYWKYTEEPVIEGTYVGPSDSVSKLGSAAYLIKLDDGTVKDVYETAQLKDRFSMVQPGWRIRIEFLGKKMGNGGKNYNNFKFDYDDAYETPKAKSKDEGEDLPF